MKFVLGVLISQFLFSTLLFAQNGSLLTVLEKELDLYFTSELMNFGKEPEQIHEENLQLIDLFIQEKMDINHNNARETFNISAEDVYETLIEMRKNPVVSLYQYNKYDPENRGIGFCFGRAMFANLHLAYKGMERDHIKKAFVIGHMQTSDGAQWGWHVATIARTERVNTKNEIVEDWFVVDPIVGYPMYLKDWYEYMREDFSVDKKLRLWITQPAKFGPNLNSYYTEDHIKAPAFNNYFVDMMEWFGNTAAAENSIYNKENWFKNYTPQVRRVIPMTMD